MTDEPRTVEPPKPCEWPTHAPTCPEPVVAKVGLPGRRALWVCARGFDEFERRYEEGA